MRLAIHTSDDVSDVMFDVPPSTFIAALKAMYRRDPRFKGPRSLIIFKIGDIVLDDMKTLDDYDISDGDVIQHEASPVQAAYTGVDYDALAAHLAREADGAAAIPGPWGAHSPAVQWGAQLSTEDTDQDKDDQDRSVSGSEIVALNRRALWSAGRGSGVAPPQVPSSRIFRQLYIAQVGRHQFKLLHRMEGRWHGEATVQVLQPTSAVVAPTSSMHDVRVCATELTWNDRAGRWHERQSLTSVGGMSHSHSLLLEPSGDGECKVIAPAGDIWNDCDVRLKELSEHVLLLTATSHASGRPLLVDTTVVMDEARRTRTVQRFDDAGNLSVVYLIRETRVLDSVSGALQTVGTPWSTGGPRRAGPGSPVTGGR